MVVTMAATSSKALLQQGAFLLELAIAASRGDPLS
jgi:hypothetical protein